MVVAPAAQLAAAGVVRSQPTVTEGATDANGSRLLAGADRCATTVLRHVLRASLGCGALSDGSSGQVPARNLVGAAEQERGQGKDNTRLNLGDVPAGVVRAVAERQ